MADITVCAACFQGAHTYRPAQSKCGCDCHQPYQKRMKTAQAAHHKRQRRERWRRTPPPIKPGMNRRQPP
jgi:hypothetical protein